jgi:hypothetical protein
VRVLTALTAPTGTAPVNILCYVRGGDNMEFGNPRRVSQTLSRFVVQSKDVTSESQVSKTMAQEGAITLPSQMRVNYGEVIKSLRVLLHRANYVSSIGRDNLAAATPMFQFKSVFGKIPPFFGFDPNGIHTATKTVGLGNAPFNFVKTQPIHWILPCFVGYRGSGVWHFNTDGTYPIGSVAVNRNPVDNFDALDNIIVVTATTSISQNSRVTMTELEYANSSGGMALTHQATQAGISVLCPNYNLYKFNSTAPGNMTLAPIAARTQDGSADDNFVYTAVVKNVATSAVSATAVKVDKYWHAGPDFQTLFFLNVPSYYLEPAIPVAV